MSKNNIIFEEDCNDSIKTNVKARKKSGPNTGWALNLDDISNFFNVRNYEQDCHIWIKGILSKCRLRINPRIFYGNKELSEHLANLDEDDLVPLELKFNRDILDAKTKNFVNSDLHHIDTQLTVGKSYKSKGWGLSKDVVSKLVPLEAYDYKFPMIVDGIKVYGRFNMQIRLFYTSKQLSHKLKELYNSDPKQKVDARIILESTNLDNYREYSVKKSRKRTNEICSICGKSFYDESGNNKCPDCLDKEITVLRLKDLLNIVSPGDEITVDGLRANGLSRMKIGIITSKLLKYGLLTEELDGSFVLKDENFLNNFIENWDKDSKDHLQKGLISEPKLELFDSGNVQSSSVNNDFNFKISQKLGKFDLLDSEDKLIGRFSSDKTANLVKSTLEMNNGDIDYFIDNNILFKFEKHYVYILKDDLIKFLGMFDSKREAQERLQEFKNKFENKFHYKSFENENSIDDNEKSIEKEMKKLKETGEEHIFKSDENYVILKNNKIFGQFAKLNDAIVVKRFLKIYHWDLNKVHEFGDGFGFNKKFYVLDVENEKVIILGEFESYLDSINFKKNKSPKKTRQQNTSKYGKHIYKIKGDKFQIQRQIKYKQHIYGVFQSLKITQFVKQILEDNDWDVDYFIDNNIFQIGEKFYVFKLNRSKVSLKGVFSSLDGAKDYLANYDDSNILEHAEKYIFKKDNKFILQRTIEQGIFQAKFDSLDWAVDLRDFLNSINWDVAYLDNLDNIFKINDKYYIFSKNNLRLCVLGIFNSFEDAFNNKEKLLKSYIENFNEITKKKTDKNIHKTRRGYSVVKRIDGNLKSFGTFDTREEAIVVRDELVANDWNIENEDNQEKPELLNPDILNEIIFRLTPWQKIVFDCINDLNSATFKFEDLQQFQTKFKRYTAPSKVDSKVLQNLDQLIDLGLLVRTDENTYQKLWNY